MKSLIIACDVQDKATFIRLVKGTCEIPYVSGYKIGFSLGLSLGLPAVTSIIRGYTNKSIIYDHQKAGTDIPDTGRLFAKTLHTCGVSSVILFPQAGLQTADAWIQACQDKGLQVVVGGMMTHPGYMKYDGGFLSGVDKIYEFAYLKGVRDFVVPGNLRYYQSYMRKRLHFLKDAPGVRRDFLFMSPGALEYSPYIDDYIVGRKIYESSNFQAACEMCADLFLKDMEKEEFTRLSQRWMYDVMFLSNFSLIAKHPLVNEFMKRKEIILPWVKEEILTKKNVYWLLVLPHWFGFAYPQNTHGDFSKMEKSFLSWEKENGSKRDNSLR